MRNHRQSGGFVASTQPSDVFELGVAIDTLASGLGFGHFALAQLGLIEHGPGSVGTNRRAVIVHPTGKFSPAVGRSSRGQDSSDRQRYDN